jgi:hypothetical protein
MTSRFCCTCRFWAQDEPGEGWGVCMNSGAPTPLQQLIRGTRSEILSDCPLPQDDECLTGFLDRCSWWDGLPSLRNRPVSWVMLMRARFPSYFDRRLAELLYPAMGKKNG